tara:strand:+ start:1482 stop:1733 length:252 start_codon:yes stop_codon:yes gene_type:complete
MATRVLYNLKRRESLIEDGYFEIKKRASEIKDIELARLYNDPTMTKERFFSSVKSHNNDFNIEEDLIYFYTTEFKPAMIKDDF